MKTIIRYFLRKTVVSAMQDWQVAEWAGEHVYLPETVKLTNMNMLA